MFLCVHSVTNFSRNKTNIIKKCMSRFMHKNGVAYVRSLMKECTYGPAVCVTH